VVGQDGTVVAATALYNAGSPFIISSIATNDSNDVKTKGGHFDTAYGIYASGTHTYKLRHGRK